MKRLQLTTLALASSTALLAAAALAGVEKGVEKDGHLMVSQDDLEWNELSSMPPGALVSVLEGDPAKDESFTMRIQFPANYKIPLHTHPAVERVTVLSGTLYLGIGETFDREEARPLSPGALAVMDEGVPMFGFTAEEPVVIQLNGTGPWGIDYLDPEEDPRVGASQQ